MNKTLGIIDMRYFHVLIKETERLALEEFGISRSDFKRNYKSRLSEYKFPRQIVMYILKIHTHASLARIGQIYNKDHATVINSVKVVENYTATDKRFSEIINRIYKGLAPLKNLSDDLKFVCNRCGLMNVTIKVEYDPNLARVIEIISDENYPGYCEKCGETVVIPLKEYHENGTNNNMETVSN
jgi:hypothetical protein